MFLANAFVDLGTWNCFTPFVGFGIGGAYNQLADFVDIRELAKPASASDANSAEWHFAWALYAGVAYNVSKNLKVDLTYRYLNYGSITDTVDCFGGCIARLLQIQQSHFPRLHARAALDLLRGAAAAALRLHAADPEQGLTAGVGARAQKARKGKEQYP